ncbi:MULTISPECIES: DNA sulfur modification protein DndD [Mycobacterium]|uniref:Nuclease SbcCD subunit C n=1 Tax=Mycobacterium syngnathidarum TaxID=1908205 RepID=A0A1Q9W3Y2_9MYCO|nr:MULTISPECIES: DNA sulfur modification protein DndD [Mycobacterium]MCG7607950.1 DNA sulfur modification protein DndD [Mycobacterium sp. CnD-18-1]OHT93329.1 DNA sulfur modification protein DndD [Mycobacterium syngnathidarum]OLT88100.1 DNA sulfur modification protein DndD [Mycobacterium syngnathidarum]
MILNKLVLHNVGTFAGRHEIDLTPTSPKKPIILIGGLNGAGKTTILESIQLALYGPLAQGPARRNGSYDNYLRGLIHRGVPVSDGAAIELTFTAHQEGAAHTYWLRRSWKSTGASIREILNVSVDGRHNQSLTSTWSEHVETFLPRGIAGLFFFDGEQIEALADLERSRQVLRSALAALLGLDLVDRLSTDLAVLKRRHRSAQVPESLGQEIDDKRQLVTALRQAEESGHEAEAARRSEVERYEKLYFEATEAFRAAGGDLLERHESSEAAVAKARASLARCEDEIRHEMAGSAPLLQVTGLLNRLIAQVNIEEGAKRAALLSDALLARDDAVLGKLRSAKVEAVAIEEVQRYLEADRQERDLSSTTDAIVEFGPPVALEFLSMENLPSVKRRLQDLVHQRSQIVDELDQAERMLAAIPDPEALAPLQEQREDARTALLRAEAALALASESLQSAQNSRVKAHSAYEAALDKVAHENLAADDDRRMVDHADRVSATLNQLRVAATRQHLGRISQLVLEALNVLLRKQNLIADVQIDPETHSVSLTGSDGRPLPATDLSAGERQLLAVALLWGLARAAGQPLPVVIDTPLGRLDGTHREHLLERYFPQASHQVVLLSTDTEIDDEALDRITKRVGRSYQLVFDSATNATSVENGYFWG